MKAIDKDIVITGIICITLLEIIALLNGINGLLLTVVIAMLAGAIGIMVPSPKWVTIKLK